MTSAADGTRRRLVGLTYEQAIYFDRLVPPELALAAQRVRGRFDLDTAEIAWAQVCRRHDALRARVHTTPTAVTQQVVPPVGRFPLVVRPVASLEELRTERGAPGDPPDLAGDGPLRVRWHPMAPDDGVLVLEISHPWADAWSVERLVWDFWDAYGRARRGDPPLDPAPFSLTTRLAAQEALTDPPASRLLQVWSDRIGRRAGGGLPPTRAAGPGPGPAEVVMDRWDVRLLAQAERLAAANRATLQMLVFAACALALSRALDGREVMLLGSAMTRGMAGEQADEVGFCQSLAPIPLAVDPDATVSELVGAARRQLVQLMVDARPPYSFTTMLRALASHEVAPAATILQRWRTGRTVASPFVAYFNPVRTAGRGAASADLRGTGLRVGSVELDPTYSPCHVFDLMLAPRFDGAHPEMRIYFRPSLPRAAVEEMASLCRAFVAADSATPAALISPSR